MSHKIYLHWCFLSKICHIHSYICLYIVFCIVILIFICWVCPLYLSLSQDIIYLYIRNNTLKLLKTSDIKIDQTKIYLGSPSLQSQVSFSSSLQNPYPNPGIV